MKRTLILILAVFGSLIAVAQPAQAAAPEPPIGLMIQVSTLQTTPVAEIKSWLDDIRANHRNPALPGYVNTVVLQDVAKPSGALYTQTLNAIAPYLPGGTKAAFTTAYVGTVDLAWTGAGSKYIEGIQNAPFRTQNWNKSVIAANNFRAAYPYVQHGWYVTYEANLSGFWSAPIEQAYRVYIAGLMTRLNGALANKTFLWSPAFWTMYNDQPSWSWGDLGINLTHLFTGLTRPLIVDVQDFVGQSAGASTKESAVQWVNYLKSTQGSRLQAVQVNVEQFTVVGGVIVAGDPVEVPAREQFYVDAGITLGPSWELRYWYQRQHP